MADYIVNRTDINAPSITVPGKRVNNTSLDVELVGKIRLEYGQGINENLLNMLENFACPEDGSTTTLYDAVPDLNETSKTQLQNPTEGQFWYNSTRGILYFWSEDSLWVPIPISESYAANWGQILHGQQLPRPVAPISGYEFEYTECIWSVAPATYLGKPGLVNCTTDADANVTMQYRLSLNGTLIDGIANYLIIGITGNQNNGVYIPLPPAPTPTPTISITPSPTPTETPSPSATATPAASVSPTPAATSTPTPAVSASTTPVATSTPTPTPAVTSTPTSTAAVTPTPTVTPSPSPLNYVWQSTGSWSGPEANCSQYPTYDVAYAAAEDFFNNNPCNAESLGWAYQMDYCDSGVVGWVYFECLLQ